jgi:hypothetical protein
VTGERPQPGPEIKGIISARSGDRMAVTAEDGTKTIISIDDATQVRGRTGLFGGKGKFSAASLMNGLPATRWWPVSSPSAAMISRPPP